MINLYSVSPLIAYQYLLFASLCGIGLLAYITIFLRRLISFGEISTAAFAPIVGFASFTCTYAIWYQWRLDRNEATINSDVIAALMCGMIFWAMILVRRLTHPLVGEFGWISACCIAGVFHYKMIF